MQKKDVVIGILGITLIVVAFGWYWTARTQISSEQIATSTSSTSQGQTPSSSTGEQILETSGMEGKKISVTVPSPLTAVRPEFSPSEDDYSIIITHGIPYRHPDGCDFKGDAPALDTFTDFSMEMYTVSDPFSSVVTQTLGSSFAKELLKGETLVTSEGYVEIYNLPIGQGYRINQSLEGCGQTVYLFPFANNTVTLVIKEMLIPEFTGIMSKEVTAPFYTLPGVIVPEKADQLRQQILNSIKIK